MIRVNINKISIDNFVNLLQTSFYNYQLYATKIKKKNSYFATGRYNMFEKH